MNGSSTLAAYRTEIDRLDAVLVEVLVQRFAVSRSIGTLKKQLGLPCEDPERETEQCVRIRQLAQDTDLDPELCEEILRRIIGASREEQA